MEIYKHSSALQKYSKYIDVSKVLLRTHLDLTAHFLSTLVCIGFDFLGPKVREPPTTENQSLYVCNR